MKNEFSAYDRLDLVWRRDEVRVGVSTFRFWRGLYLRLGVCRENPAATGAASDKGSRADEDEDVEEAVVAVEVEGEVPKGTAMAEGSTRRPSWRSMA